MVTRLGPCTLTSTCSLLARQLGLCFPTLSPPTPTPFLLPPSWIWVAPVSKRCPGSFKHPPFTPPIFTPLSFRGTSPGWCPQNLSGGGVPPLTV